MTAALMTMVRLCSPATSDASYRKRTAVPQLLERPRRASSLLSFSMYSGMRPQSASWQSSDFRSVRLRLTRSSLASREVVYFVSPVHFVDQSGYTIIVTSSLTASQWIVVAVACHSVISPCQGPFN